MLYRRLTRRSLLGLGLALPAAAQFPPGAVERGHIADRATELADRVEGLRGTAPDFLLAEVEIYHKALDWLLRDDEELHRRIYAHDALNISQTGLARAAALEGGEAPWTKERGKVARAYRSRIDGSVQPYAVWVPPGYDPLLPGRLDVVLHGRNSRLNEVSFLAAAERSAAGGPGYLVLEVFGRTNNAYRWAGEADVFEALAAVRRSYRFDPDRVVLRGFSMGGAGAWHLGLHHPDRWAAMEAGAGFTDTLTYARKSLPAGGLAGDWQRKTLHIYDAVDYAENAWNLSTVGYGGEDDAQLQASINIREALETAGAAFRPDGLNWTTRSPRAIFLVGPKTGHRFHPESKARSEAFLRGAVKERRAEPDEIRFVTYTTKYPRCFWATLDGLGRHYERAEVRARRDPARTVLQATTVNVSRLIFSGAERLKRIEIDGRTIVGTGAPKLYLGRENGQWRSFRDLDSLRGADPVKRPGLQGPIDDAFAAPFLVVRPSGKTPAGLDLFQKEYAKWMRADLPIVSAAEVEDADVAAKHLALFGDPDSNALLARVADKLPLPWTPGLRLIAPNPLNPERYVVINSGHTFHEKGFRGTNALLYPRLGDWAIMGADGAVQRAGVFDERWRVARG